MKYERIIYLFILFGLIDQQLKLQEKTRNGRFAKPLCDCPTWFGNNVKKIKKYRNFTILRITRVTVKNYDSILN